MQEYKNKQELVDEISKRAKLFIDEFSDIPEVDKNKLIEGVERTPAQMIAYQLGWINLILYWEQQEQQGITVKTPHPNYKWNNLGGLYEGFYKRYEEHSLQELCSMFQESEQQIIQLIENNFTNSELFHPGGRKWASSTSVNWPIWKWIHINTVAPFKSFRTKIRKWKKLTSVENDNA
ncbi:MAG: ClbS/DfsB family four-helix bundle protein [Tissierella sp.]|nr:ClbS/DfsB family four-helix bundle protein [Tissierella sp.]